MYLYYIKKSCLYTLPVSLLSIGSCSKLTTLQFIIDNFSTLTQVKPADWAAAEASLEVDCSIKEVTWATAGTAGGLAMLEEFCSQRLKNFSKDRNDPAVNGLSNLSPWFHFGEKYIIDMTL